MSQVQTLYNQTLAASKQFASYNFRNYFVRRTNEKFAPFIQTGSASTTSASNQTADSAWLEERKNELAVLDRAGKINTMFQGPKLVVERSIPITGMRTLQNGTFLSTLLTDCRFFNRSIDSRWR